jgi:2-keto-3-deoxy-L-rhamnonate aldolase RhmA
MINPLKKRLKEGKIIIGPWIGLAHSEIPIRLSNVGFDFLLYDMEHAPLNRENIADMIKFQSYQSNCVPLVRLPWNNIWLTKHMLDIGAYGLVIPWVNSKEEAVNAVRFSKYPPWGVRGCAPGFAAFNDPQYIETANNETLVIVQIETKTAVDNLEDILSVKGIDATLIGPLDMAMSYGWYGQPDREELTKKVVRKIVQTCHKYDVAPGMAVDPDRGFELGIQCIFTASPTSWIVDGAKSLIQYVKSTRKWKPSY